MIYLLKCKDTLFFLKGIRGVSRS